MTNAVKVGLGFAIITDKEFYALPIPKYFLDSQYQIHRDLLPAIIWADGEKEYWLNGVKCSEEIITTKSEQLNPELLLKEQNAEIRREIVRKIGIERVCQKLNAKCINKKWDYELLLLDLGDGRNRPYLKMKNPSIGTYHLEGISPEIKTVEEALNWRNQTTERPIILT